MHLPRKQTTCVPTRAAAVAAAVLAMWSPGILHRAQAEDLKVYSPIVEEGEIAFEARGNVAVDSDPAKRGEENQHYELEYTPNSYWHTALIGEAHESNRRELLGFDELGPQSKDADLLAEWIGQRESRAGCHRGHHPGEAGLTMTSPTMPRLSWGMQK